MLTLKFDIQASDITVWSDHCKPKITKYNKQPMGCEAQLAYSNQRLDVFLGFWAAKQVRVSRFLACDQDSLVGLCMQNKKVDVFLGHCTYIDYLTANVENNIWNTEHPSNALIFYLCGLWWCHPCYFYSATPLTHGLVRPVMHIINLSRQRATASRWSKYTSTERLIFKKISRGSS